MAVCFKQTWNTQRSMKEVQEILRDRKRMTWIMKQTKIRSIIKEIKQGLIVIKTLQSLP